MDVIHWIRRRLWSLDSRLAVRERIRSAPPASRSQEIERFLGTLDLDDDARAYLEDNMERIATTLSLVPPPRRSKRVLELGAYMQMTPALGCLLDYQEVRGAYLGPLGRTDTKLSTVNGEEVFRCQIDLFDVERDRFPYDDGRFETVLACEVIEHLLLDPMHMLLEIHRVLEEQGIMILTTPNVTSFWSVARVLTQSGNPQVYSRYPNPRADNRATEIPHVREYTPFELQEAVEAAGFEIETLSTEPWKYDQEDWVRPLLERHGYATSLRGEQVYCVARKTGRRRTRRYPSFLYDGV